MVQACQARLGTSLQSWILAMKTDIAEHESERPWTESNLGLGFGLGFRVLPACCTFSKLAMETCLASASSERLSKSWSQSGSPLTCH